MAGAIILTITIHLTQTADIALWRGDAIAIDILAALISVRITFTAFAPTTEWFASFITFKIIATGSAARAIYTLITNRRIAPATHIAK